MSGKHMNIWKQSLSQVGIFFKNFCCCSDERVIEYEHERIVRSFDSKLRIWFYCELNKLYNPEGIINEDSRIDGKAHISGYKRWEESDTIASILFLQD